MVEDTGDAYEKDGMRSAGSSASQFKLEAPELLDQVDELGDRVSIQILSLFPGFVLHQIRNSLAARQVVPKGVDRTELHWTLFGFADDDDGDAAPPDPAGQPGRARPATSRWRTAPRPASSSAAWPDPPTAPR
jgi:hypothetical protein